MSGKMTREAALQELGQMLEVSPSQLAENLTPQDLETWDSLGHLNIIAFLDSAFGIDLSTEESQTITSLGSILDLIGEKSGFA